MSDLNWSVLDLVQDPVPGDPAETRALAARLLREAEHAEQHANRLRQVAANHANLRMEGDYAARFQAVLAELPQPAASLGPAHEACGKALTAYAETLEEAKTQSRIALSRGIEADAQYTAALQQFYSVVPVSTGGGLWRGLNGATAGYLSQYQTPEIRQMAVQIGSYAGQAEQERQAAALMARKAAQAVARAEAQCAETIRAAAGRTSENGLYCAAAGRSGETATSNADAAVAGSSLGTDLEAVRALVKEGDGAAGRGVGDPPPSPDDVKQALINCGLQRADRSRYTSEDGHYYATNVFVGGREDGETVFSGHGYLEYQAGTCTVPPGTHVSFYVPHGDLLPGRNGVAIEAGVLPRGYVETFHPGDTVPDYTLAPPAAPFGGSFSVMENSVTVSKRTRLSELLKPGMGNVHWAACREIQR
ncbi:WXG100 family type VII secretion target [Streptomyces asiaticus]